MYIAEIEDSIQFQNADRFLFSFLFLNTSRKWKRKKTKTISPLKWTENYLVKPKNNPGVVKVENIKICPDDFYKNFLTYYGL